MEPLEFLAIIDRCLNDLMKLHDAVFDSFVAFRDLVDNADVVVVLSPDANSDGPRCLDKQEPLAPDYEGKANFCVVDVVESWISFEAQACIRPSKPKTIRQHHAHLRLLSHQWYIIAIELRSIDLGQIQRWW